MIRDARSQRTRVFKQLDGAVSPSEILDVQIAVSEAVCEAEYRKTLARSRESRVEIGEEIRLFRSYCDAIAWILLHPHAIRQLAGRPGRPPSLRDLGEVLDRYIELARASAGAGVPTIIPDLTNIIRVADIILVHNREIPHLIEIKGEKVIAPLDMLGPEADPSRSKIITGDEVWLGRAGRQLSVMRDVTRYLATGRGSVFGYPGTKVAIECDVKAEYHWPEIEHIVTKSLEEGYASLELAEGHWVMGIRDGEGLRSDEAMLDGLRPSKQLIVACHYEAVEESWADIPPPFNWPLSEHTRFALMEGDVLLATVLDTGTLESVGFDGVKIARVWSYGKRFGIQGMEVSYGGESFLVSNRFLNEVLYGFRTRESAVREVCHSVIKGHSLLTEQEDA